MWRQNGPADAGRFETHELAGVSDEASFLEMLDQLNEQLNDEGKEPVTFDHDCREGICGTCSLMIDGQAHGPEGGTATCQLHMRKFTDGATITVEPWRAEAFPIVKDLMVDRSPFDRIIEAGGFITVPTGSAPDANLIPVPKPVADSSMDAAQCIGCGACVAACPNGAANLFTAAKVAHLNLLPQGQSERYRRVEAMVDTMEQYFGSCTNHGECESACPKTHLDRLHRADEPGLPGRQDEEPAQAVARPHRLTEAPDCPGIPRAFDVTEDHEPASDDGGSGTLPAVAAGEPALTGFDRAYQRLGERQARQLMDDVRDSPQRAVAPGERAAAFLVACGVHLVTAGLVVGGVVLVVATWFNAVGWSAAW